MLEFRTEKVTGRVTRIFGFLGEIMYLVEGEQMAALLDTGSGIGSLKACVDKLTKKPVIVLITHGHVDHAMGAIEFKEIYMNHEDDYIYNEHRKRQFRVEGISACPPELGVTSADVLDAPEASVFKDLKDGDCFSLGGVHVEIYTCPGHTKGSVVMLIPEERALLIGDACNPFTFMFDAYSTSIDEYEKNLRNLKRKLEGKYDTVYISHGEGNAHKKLIEGTITVCEDIKNGNTDDVPFEFKGAKGVIAKAILPDMRRADGGIGNIVYNKNHIYD